MKLVIINWFWLAKVSVKRNVSDDRAARDAFKVGITARQTDRELIHRLASNSSYPLPTKAVVGKAFSGIRLILNLHPAKRLCGSELLITWWSQVQSLQLECSGGPFEESFSDECELETVKKIVWLHTHIMIIEVLRLAFGIMEIFWLGYLVWRKSILFRIVFCCWWYYRIGGEKHFSTVTWVQQMQQKLVQDHQSTHMLLMTISLSYLTWSLEDQTTSGILTA